MDELTVKTETLPSRCEICHQSDQFDPINGKCLRCEYINKDNNLPVRVEWTYNLTANDLFKFQLYSLQRKLSIQVIYGGLLLYLSYSMFTRLFYGTLLFKILFSIAFSLLFIIPGLVITVILLFFNSRAKKNKAKLTDYKLIVSDKCIIEESRYKRDQFNWIGIQKIGQNKKYIYIYDSENSAVVIPKRCFTNKMDEANFMDLINQNWKKSLVT
jgi:hypothetical protein